MRVDEIKRPFLIELAGEREHTRKSKTRI